MAAEYNQEQRSGLGSELDEPRRTTDQVKSDEFGSGGTGIDSSEPQQFGGGSGIDSSEPRQFGGGYGGVSEDQPPHHKIHSDDEPLPKPAPGTYSDEFSGSQGGRDEFSGSQGRTDEFSGSQGRTDEFSGSQGRANEFAGSEGRREDQVIPSQTGEGGYGDAPRSFGDDQQYGRDTQPAKFDESPVQTESTGTGIGQGATTGRHADPSEAFPGAPVDRKVEEPGYGYDQKTSEPAISPTTETGAQTSDFGATDTGASKKEGFMTKIKEKLPGHHKSTDATTDVDTTMEQDTNTGASPKKGLMTKIKEKLPGHHQSTATE